MENNANTAKNSPIVVGLDIGTTKICAIVGRRSEFGKIEVLGIGKADSSGVTRGVVSNIQKTVQGIAKLGKEISGSKVLVMGVTFKENCPVESK